MCRFNCLSYPRGELLPGLICAIQIQVMAAIWTAVLKSNFLSLSHLLGMRLREQDGVEDGTKINRVWDRGRYTGKEQAR